MPDAVLLVGGESRRFGRPKAAARWRGKALAAHVRDALPDGVGRIVLVQRRADDTPPIAADVVTADAPGSAPGPVAGVVAGLRACAQDRAWVVACDLPGLQPAVLEELARAWEPNDVALIPVWAGRLQPLCALYAASSADALEAAADSGIRSLIGALEAVGARILPEERIRPFDPCGLSFHNVNTPADLDALERPPGSA